MESNWYLLSEALICFVPVFLIISLVGAALLWNSLPNRKKTQAKDDE
jgi:hypothetical protein